MKISELVRDLEQLRKVYGDAEVTVQWMWNNGNTECRKVEPPVMDTDEPAIVVLYPDLTDDGLVK